MSVKYESLKTEVKRTRSGGGRRKRGTFLQPSVRRRRCVSLLLGIVAGFVLGVMLLLLIRRRPLVVTDNRGCNNRVNAIAGPGDVEDELLKTAEKNPLKLVGIVGQEDYKGLVFVGVMTAQKFLSTRAVAVYETWGREIDGKIAFFAAQTALPPPNHPTLPLVPLRTVDDSYPPQKKSFFMLQYMYENFGDHFEWFMRADDDLYVHPEKLARFLRSIDSTKSYYIGQAGRGNQKEFGLLSLEYDENFCMGGPGVILSRATLAKIAPNLKECLQNLYTTHEDVELGRCVRKYAGIPCTWSYEMQTILYHNSSGKEAFTGNLKTKEVHRAITLHPVKQHNHMYRIHNYMKGLKIRDLQHEKVLLNRDIVSMAVALNYSVENASKIQLGPNMTLFTPEEEEANTYQLPHQFGMPPGLNKFKPSRTEDVLTWDFIARSLYSDKNANPRMKIPSPLREGLDDVIREVMESMNKHSKQRGRVIEFRELLYGYHRVNPLYGADYILDMLLVYKKYRGRKMTVPVRRHAYLQQQFTSIEIREVYSEIYDEFPDGPLNEKVMEDDIIFFNNRKKRNPGPVKTPETAVSSDLMVVPPKNQLLTLANIEFARKDRINFILPLAGRFPVFRRFMATFEEVCLKMKENSALYVILFPSEVENTGNETLGLIQAYQNKYPKAKIVLYPIFTPFARAMALDQGAKLVSRPDDLMFFIDVDIDFTRETLARVRLNTIRSKRVYFPIVFSEYDPEVTSMFDKNVARNQIRENAGYWRQFGFGIASMYKTDYKKVGGLDTKIEGWGKEDVDLYTKFITSPNSTVSIFRAVDPGLIHRFHTITCSSKLDEAQYKMCKDTKYETYGSVPYLARILVSNLTSYINFAKSQKNKNVPSN